ncbi:MAG: SGNH/GDSL hydrolase family protein [Clostridia bacterium]|nr:SGNH/GDSL hydrolase family protein [Clostridia bacterium]
MKKVFLLGDSIRLGYDRYVRELLEGEAEVCYSDDNGRFAGYTFIGIPAWSRQAGDPDEVAVVHWNNGHWDCAHFDGDSEPYSTVEEYAAWLRRVHACIRRHFPNAQVIFATTTGVAPGRYERMANPRSNAEIAAYNAAAEQVMAELGVPVNDLAAFSADFPIGYYADEVHFTETGSRLLAGAVAEKIREYL